MPLKRAVLPLLDRTEPLAVEVGGANTVVFERGERLGYNTDVPGMVAALAEAGVTAPAGATILGAGATACAALAALRETGLRSVGGPGPRPGQGRRPAGGRGPAGDGRSSCGPSTPGPATATC